MQCPALLELTLPVSFLMLKDDALHLESSLHCVLVCLHRPVSETTAQAVVQLLKIQNRGRRMTRITADSMYFGYGRLH